MKVYLMQVGALYDYSFIYGAYSSVDSLLKDYARMKEEYINKLQQSDPDFKVENVPASLLWGFMEVIEMEVDGDAEDVNPIEKYLEAAHL